MNKNTLHIIAFDGGGMRGYYSVKMLQHIEKALQINANEAFGGFCGTSTGAIISAALAVGKNSQEIADFYKIKGEEVCPKAKFSFKLPILGEFDTLEIKQLLKDAKYDYSKLKIIIEEITEGKSLHELNKKVAITAYNATKKSAFLFNNLDGTNTQDFSLVDAVLSSGAAPSYLPPYIVEMDNEANLFYDGGLFANNPVLLSLKNWIAYAKENGFTEVKILSVSCFNPVLLKNISPKTPNSLVKMRNDLLDMFLYAQSLNADSFLAKETHIDGVTIKYQRIEGCCPTLETPKITIHMDTVSPEALQMMEQHAECEFERTKDRIVEFLHA